MKDVFTQMNAEVALEAIEKTLFPPTQEREGGIRISAGAYDNLEGVRLDLKRMGGDPVCIRTIERVQRQLAEVSKILLEAGHRSERL